MAAVVTKTKPRRAAPVQLDLDETTNRYCVRIPTSAFTLAGFRRWATSDACPEKLRITFVDGEIIVDMSLEDPENHVAVKTEISRVLASIARQERLGKFYNDGLLVSNEFADVSNSPDATFFTGESYNAGRVRVLPRENQEGQYAEIEGTPDWVMEVISNSSVRKDMVQLKAAYHRAGIREYWLIDARRTEVSFQILHWRKNGYVAAPNRDGWQRSQVFGRWFRLERQRDEYGLWEYTLQSQENS